MKRWIRFVIVVVALANPALAYGAAPSVEDLVDISQKVNEYCQYWMLKEYHPMYAYLTEEVKQSTRVMDFIKTCEETSRLGFDVVRHTVVAMEESPEFVSVLVKISFFDTRNKEELSERYLFEFIEDDSEWLLAGIPVRESDVRAEEADERP